MKTTATSLLLVLFIMSTLAQKQITVEATTKDVSNNLDLQAVASVFGESNNLEDFEKRLNDYDSKISNLDMNADGEVDYLRVIESTENSVHIVIIQAVLAKDVFQDVATIAVEKKDNRKTVIQIIGNPYMYGSDYIIEPVYVYTPRIYTSFWGNSYQCWSSPYSWGYYPTYYRYRSPYEVNVYVSHIHSHINYSHRYYYTNNYRINYTNHAYNSISRNDYGVRYPDRAFAKRNINVKNKVDIQPNRGNVQRDGQIMRQSSPNTQGSRMSSGNRSESGVNSRSTGVRTNTNPANVNRSTQSRSNSTGNVNRSSSESRSSSGPASSVGAKTVTPRSEARPSQSRQNSGSENRSTPSVNRSENSRSSSPAVSQPSRRSESTAAPRTSAPSRSSAPASRSSDGSRR